FAKGIVRREVVETVTPGTVLTDDWLERNRNYYVVAVDPREPGAGLAALDLITGELVLETVPAAELLQALARYEPAEVVLPAGVSLATPPPTTRTERDPWEFDAELARQDLGRTFGLASLDGLGVEPGDRPAVSAAGALLRYARELKPGGLPHLSQPRIVRRGDLLPLDEMTRRNLEPVESLRLGAGGGGGGPRCSSGRRSGSACSPTWPASLRARSSTDRPRSSRTATPCDPGTTGSSTT